MKYITINNYTFERYISRESINEAIVEVAKKIDRDYKDSPKEPIFLVTLSGAMLFASDLIKELEIDCQWDFVKCSSYHCDMSSQGLKLDTAPTCDMTGRDVLIVEDIVEKGNTIEFLYNYCKSAGANSVKIATLTLKKEIYKKSLTIDYVGICVDNDFLIGYGMDYAYKGRGLKDIYKLKQ